MIGFSISIPLNAFIFLCPVPKPEPGDELALAGMAYVVILNLGQILGVAALALLFAHFGWIYGVLFFSTSASVYVLFAYLAHGAGGDSPKKQRAVL